MNGLLDAAAEQLRLLGGWSEHSKMPWRYARRFVARMANENNLGRTKHAAGGTTHLATLNNETAILYMNEAEYDPFV
jgi:hypothetical protein